MKYYCTQCHIDLDPVADKSAIKVLSNWKSPIWVREQTVCYRCLEKAKEHVKKLKETK